MDILLFLRFDNFESLVLGFKVDKLSKILMKTSNLVEYIKSYI